MMTNFLVEKNQVLYVMQNVDLKKERKKLIEVSMVILSNSDYLPAKSELSESFKQYNFNTFKLRYTICFPNKTVASVLPCK
jgi:hypothetical protein